MTRPNLRDLLDHHFNDAELRQLCFDLVIEYENLPGDTRLTKAQSLVEFCLRHDRLTGLVMRSRALRPTVSWPDGDSLADEWQKLQRGKAAQEGLHGVLPHAQVADILAALQKREADLLAQLIGSSAIALGDGAVAVGERGVNVGGSVGGDIIPGQKVVVTVEQGATFVMNNADQRADTPALDRDSAVNRYLTHIIAHNRYLQLQGVRSGGRLVHIELEQIYITLRATQQRTVSAEERWLAQEAQLAPGERHRNHSAARETVTELVTVSVNEALTGHRRLVVLGDPGSGKTTLLRYLALIYGRDASTALSARSTALSAGDAAGPIHRLLGLPERGCLPILLPLRQIGAYLKDHSEESTEGPRLLLEFLRRYLANERIDVPLNFFDPYLAQGQAVVLLDGLDEVPGADLRRRVARLVERFTQAYPACRYVVTSRIVGYEGAARLGEGYTTTTVQEFSLADVEQFLRYWHRLVWIGQMGPGPTASRSRNTACLSPSCSLTTPTNGLTWPQSLPNCVTSARKIGWET